MDIHRPLAAIALALAVGTAVPAMAGPVAHETGPDLVANGGFETGDFSGWTARVDTDFSGVDSVAAHSGGFGAYFGDAGTPGSIGQSLATLAGASYNIHLWVRSDGLTPNSLSVLWGSTTVFSAIDFGPSGYAEIVIDPQATGATTALEIRARNDAGFLEVDDISVRQVPEPIGLALLGPGLLGMVALRRRKA